MLMPTKDRTAIYEYIFEEGVMVAKKDIFATKHMILSVKNLYVIKTMQSLCSRQYVNQKVSWGHYYWYLTNKGVEYLRDYLNLPSEIVPATLKTKARQDPLGVVPRAPNRLQFNEEKSGEHARTESSYRREDNGSQFKGGFGRGHAPGMNNQ